MNYSPIQRDTLHASRDTLKLTFGQFEKKMQNEPNLKNTQMNLNLFKTTNYIIFRPLQRRKNEPNLWKTNPIQTTRLLSWPAVRPLSIYSGQALRNTAGSSSSLRPKQHTLSKPRIKNAKRTQS